MILLKASGFLNLANTWLRQRCSLPECRAAPLVVDQGQLKDVYRFKDPMEVRVLATRVEGFV